MPIFPKEIKTIAVIALSGIPDLEKVTISTNFLKKHGYKVKILDSVYERTKSKYLAAKTERRIDDLHQCWLDKNIDLIIAVRGGFGSAHLLDLIDWNIIKTRSVPFIGYSDLTAIHVAMYSKGISNLISGPMFQNIGSYSEDFYTLQSMHDSLNYNQQYQIEPCLNCKFEILKEGNVSAPIIPVTLSVLVTLLGTQYMPSLKNKILLIEDVNEPIYKLDRYMTQLEQCGILKVLKGLLFGNFIKCGAKKDRFCLFNKVADMVNGPVVCNIPFGHAFPRISVGFGAKCTITAEKEVTIKITP